MIRKLIIAGTLMMAVSPSFAEEISKADLDRFLIVQKRVAPVAEGWQKKIGDAPSEKKDALRVQAFRDVEKAIKQKPGYDETAQYFATAKMIKQQADAAKMKK